MKPSNAQVTLRRAGAPLQRTAIFAAFAALAASLTVTLTAPATVGAQELSVPLVEAAAPTALSAKKTPKKIKRTTVELAGKVNINTADAKQLQLLPGVGPAKAERVVEWREKRGRFKRVQDLRRVKGFGRKSLAKLAPYLTLKGDTTLRKKTAADEE